MAPGGDGTAVWRKALAWIGEAGEPAHPARAPTMPPVDRNSLRGELGLHDALTVDDLQRIRREFMWANHPDRCAGLPTEVATQRVAIANMLIDEAVQNLANTISVTVSK
jgi:hypothetical protein